MDVKDVIERVNDDIIEVISHYVELKKKGQNYTGPCPFHNEKTASFVVSPAKGLFKCFGCGKGGDAIKFVTEHEQVDFKEAITIATKKLNIDFEWRDQQRNFNEADYLHKEALMDMCRKAALFFIDNLKANNTALQYLQGRNHDVLPDDQFMLGYAPSGNRLLKWAEENQYNRQLLIEAGLIGVNDGTKQYYDFFRDRIMFPICSKTGKIIGFTGRDLSNKPETAKYLNSPDTEIFTKGKELFGLNIARHQIKQQNRAYLVEGNFDVRRLHAIGINNTVAPCGTSLTIDQCRLLKHYTRNVTLIYDGDSAGRKAIQKNGELLVREQFNVMVMMLPNGHDPDSLFPDIKAFDDFKDGRTAANENEDMAVRHIDYIVFRATNEVSRCQNPAYKSEIVKDIAALIVCYDEPSLHEVYLDAVSKLIKPKKLWQDALKMQAADKPMVEKKVYIPPTVSAEDLLTYGFYADNNRYFFADKNDAPKQRSNFTLNPIAHIESTINSKRIYEVKNDINLVRIVEIPQKDLVSLSAFQVNVESLGNFWFNGSQTDLNKLKRWLYEKTETCREINQMGWQKEGFYAWGNGVFNGDFHPVDTYGIVKHGKQGYYIPAFSSIFEREKTLFQYERRFIHMEGNVTLKEYARKFTQVYGEQGKIALCYYFASVFYDIVTDHFGTFPMLNMFGPKGAGKTACAESLVQFFGRLGKSPNLHNTSKAALGDHVASAANAICHLDEYRNDLEMEKREFLKGIWDRAGRTRKNMDKDKKNESTAVDQAVIITGQQMATADIALFTRFVFLCFTQTEYTNDEREAFKHLKEIEKRGLTHITHMLIRLRADFADNFKANVKQMGERMRAQLRNEVVEDRLFNNWLIPIAAYSTIADHLELPWDKHELVKLAANLLIRQNKETKSNDDLGHFWKVVQFLASSNVLFDRGDYKIEMTQKITRRYFENGQWGKQVITFEAPTQLLFLTTSRVFSLYKQQCLREGDKPLPDSTVEYYLRNSSAFICETKKETFRKIDPKTGYQEQDPITQEKKRTSTTALVFNYAKLGLSISTSNADIVDDDIEEQPTPSVATQSELPFAPPAPPNQQEVF